MTKVRFFLAVIILAGLAAVIEAIYLAHRAANPAPATALILAPAAPTSAAPFKPSPLGEGGPASGPGEGLRPETISQAPAAGVLSDESTRAAVMAQNFTYAATAVSAASAAPARSDQELDRAREVLADRQVDLLLARLNLTDQQQQIGQDAIDQLRKTMKTLVNSGQGLRDTLKQKIANFHNQGFTDDQIAGLIRPDLETIADHMSDQFATMGHAILQLQPILMPDQLKTLNQITDGFQAVPAQLKSQLTSDERLKQFVQMFK